MGPAGITAVLVQRRDLDRPELEAVSFLTLAAGVLLTLLTFAFSHAGADDDLRERDRAPDCDRLAGLADRGGRRGSAGPAAA